MHSHLSVVWAGNPQSLGGPSEGIPGGAVVADSALMGSTNVTRLVEVVLQTKKEQSTPHRKNGQCARVAQHPLGNLPILGKALMKKGFDKRTATLILDAWRLTTKKNYTTYLQKWSLFCKMRAIDPTSPTLPQACR